MNEREILARSCATFSLIGRLVTDRNLFTLLANEIATPGSRSCANLRVTYIFRAVGFDRKIKEFRFPCLILSTFENSNLNVD